MGAGCNPASLWVSGKMHMRANEVTGRSIETKQRMTHSGWSYKTPSSSIDEIFSPPLMTISLARSRRATSSRTEGSNSSRLVRADGCVKQGAASAGSKEQIVWQVHGLTPLRGYSRPGK